MKLSRSDLKKIQYEFNRISNRLMQADVDDYSLVLKRFIHFVDSTEIIHDYILGCGESLQNWDDEFAKVRQSYSTVFILGDSDDEETCNIYALLKYAVENAVDVPHGVSFGYSSSRKFADNLKKFNERVTFVLIQHIESYLTKIGIDMGLDENRVFNITNNNGQVNVATDNAAIIAQYNNGIDQLQLTKLIEAVINNIAELTVEDKSAVQESIDVINHEAIAKAPKKSLLKTALNTMKAIKGTAEFGAAVSALVSFIQPLI